MALSQKQIDNIHGLTIAIQNTNNKVYRITYMANICQNFGLNVDEWKGIYKLSAIHLNNKTLHNKLFPNSHTGRAFDAHYPISNPLAIKKMERCALYFRDHLTPYLTEGIFNGHKPGHNLSVKNRCPTTAPAAFWGQDVWDMHHNHIHIAI